MTCSDPNRPFRRPVRPPLADWARPADLEAVFAQHMLRRWASGLVGRPGVRGNQTVAGVPVSVLIQLSTRARLALCYVSKTLDAESWRRQHTALEGAGVAGTWIFPAREEYLAAPHPNPDSATDGADGLIADTPLFKAMRMDGSWPLIFNIQKEEVANLIAPHRKLAKDLGIKPPPFVGGVLHVLISQLGECHLCDSGVVTPSVSAGVLWASRNGYLKASPRYASSQAQSRGEPQLPLIVPPAEAA